MMKKKLLTTIIATCIAIITAFTFSACGAQSIGSAEFMGGLKEVGVTYYKTHDSYDNFADTTATFIVDYERKYETTLSYYKNEGDTQLTEELFTNTLKEKAQITFSAKKIDGTLFVTITDKSEIEDNYYYVDEDNKLVQNAFKGVETTVYEYGRENGAVTDKGYFVRKYTSEIEDEEPAIETKNYYKYNNEEAYKSAINNLIDSFNSYTINRGVFMNDDSGMLMLMSSMMNFSKDGNAYIMSMDMSTVDFSNEGDYDYVDGKATYRIVAGGDLIVNIDGETESMYEGGFSKTVSDQEVKVVNSSSLTSIQAPYDGYEESLLLALDTEPANLVRRMQASLSYGGE